MVATSPCVKDAAGGDEGAGAEAFGRGTDTPKQPDRRDMGVRVRIMRAETPPGTPNNYH
jgi:hypothetical protein